MLKYYTAVLASLLISSQAAADALSTEEVCIHKVYAHILVQDYNGACRQAWLSLQKFPNNQTLYEAYIKALAKAGDETAMCQAFEHYSVIYPEDAKSNNDLQEALAWGVISKASQSSSPIPRLFGMLAAYFAQDAKSIEILCKKLHDPNNQIRWAAVKLSAGLRDAAIADEILRILRSERVWKVRQEAIKAIGPMKLKIAQPDLMAVLSNETSSHEEIAIAIQSLLLLLDNVNRNELIKLSSSNRAGLRLLACEVIDHLSLKKDVDLIVPLVADNRAEVRTAALQAIGQLRVEEIGRTSVVQLARSRLNDRDPEAAISAAWLLTLHDPARGGQALTQWINHPDREVRLLAAGALVSTGCYGLPLLKKTFQENQDPYIRMTLALGLINQNINTEEACEVLYKGLVEEKGRWMWQETSIFRALAPSDIKHDPDIPNHPESVNQTTRLDILNILAIMKYPKAQDAIKIFLKEKKWGITVLASKVLLTEGDESALALVHNLLDDQDPKIRTNAAMILALWGRGEDAVAVLEASYKNADRETKEKILEALGRVGARSSIPFMIDKLQEPMQTLRVMAAAALLQCLYH